MALVKKGTRRFVQQQYNWFRLDDPQIHWLDEERSGADDALTLLKTAG